MNGRKNKICERARKQKEASPSTLVEGRSTRAAGTFESKDPGSQDFTRYEAHGRCAAAARSEARDIAGSSALIKSLHQCVNRETRRLGGLFYPRQRKQREYALRIKLGSAPFARQA